MKQKNRGFEVTKAYWCTSVGKTVRLNKSDWESVGWKRKIKTLENRDKYSSKYLVGVIGEKEGRKWLTEQGYKVYEFGMMEYYFEELENTVDGLKRRRKQEYIEEDKIYVNALEHKLKGVFCEKFEEMRKFFCAFLQQRKEIKEEARRTRRFADQIGGISPDFIVKKNNDFSFVEVKANTSVLTKHQRMCFEIVKGYGFKTMVLEVKVESNVPKDMCLTEF